MLRLDQKTLFLLVLTVVSLLFALTTYIKTSCVEMFAVVPQYGHVYAMNGSDVDNWALSVTEHQKKVFSQGGQDGSLEYIFSKIGPGKKEFVEFGFSSPDYGMGTGANTEYLFRQGWRGLLLDGANTNPTINLRKEWIKPDTIVKTLLRNNVSLNVDYLSIDIDSSDLWVFRAIISSKMRPRVITVEYNSNHPLTSTICNLGGKYNWKGDRLFGSSLAALNMVAEEFDYALVDVVPTLDAVFVHKDELRGSAYPSFYSWAKTAVAPLHKIMHDRASATGFVVDYNLWKRKKIIDQNLLEASIYQLCLQKVPVLVC